MGHPDRDIHPAMETATERRQPLSAELELTPMESEVWRGLLSTHSSIIKSLDTRLEEAHGIALSTFEALLALDQASEGQLRMADLAEHMALSRSGMTRLCDRLQRSDLIDRKSCSDDARGSYAAITEQGRELLKQAYPTYIAGVRECFLHYFSESELVMVAQCWQRFAGNDRTL